MILEEQFMSQAKAESLESESKMQARRVSVGPVEVKVTVMVDSPDPGGPDADQPTKAGLGPRKKSVGMTFD